MLRNTKTYRLNWHKLMYQQGKLHAGSFDNVNVQCLGHHKNDVIKSNLHRCDHN